MEATGVVEDNQCHSSSQHALSPDVTWSTTQKFPTTHTVDVALIHEVQLGEDPGIDNTTVA